MTVRLNYVAAGGGDPVVKEPKTAAGTRTLQVPPHIAPALAAHLKTFVASKRDAWLFTTDAGDHLSPRGVGTV